MRVLTFALAALLLGSLPPPLPAKLPPSAPQILISNADCATAQRTAGVIAKALGFSPAQVPCSGRGIATLKQPTTPGMTAVPDLIAYSFFDWSSSVLRVWPRFQVASDIPFAAATSNLVAYVKLNALLIRLHTENEVRSAFALEDAGISRQDVTNDESSPGWLYVRVHPITDEHLMKIVHAVSRSQNSTPSYETTGFVRHCNADIASLSGIAVADAHRRASVMANAAGTTLGGVLGVVDFGGTVTDAVCGLGGDATVHDLVTAAARSPRESEPVTSPLHATILRTISAAWRLEQGPNPPGPDWYANPDFSGAYWLHGQGAFVADGLRVHGNVLWPHEMEPNRAFIQVPENTYNIVARAPDEPKLTHVGNWYGTLYPAIVLEAKNNAELETRIANLRSFVSRADPIGKALDGWSYYFIRKDCSTSIDGALYWATRDALARTGGKPVRYLVQESDYSDNIACTYYPGLQQAFQWLNSSEPHKGFSSATVIAGY